MRNCAGLAIFAVEEIAHGFAALGGKFAFVFAASGIECSGRSGTVLFRLAAGGAAVGEAGLAGPQLKLLMADDTDANRKRHTLIW